MESQKRIARSTGVVSAGIMISRISGYLRDMSIAAVFGANWVTDAFFIAFRIPNLFRKLLGEGALSMGFIPIFTKYLTTEKKEETWKLASLAINLLLVVSSLITLFVLAFPQILVRLIAPGEAFMASGAFKLAITLTRIMFPFMIFICLAALVMGMLNSLSHFFTPAFASALLNLSMIASCFLLAPLFSDPIIGLAIGVLIGGVLQLLIQIPPLLRRGFRYSYIFDLAHPGLKELLRLFVPATLGLATTQLSVVIGSILASMLSKGSISYLYNADRLIELPVSLFGVALAQVTFPAISRQIASSNLKKAGETITLSLRMIIFACLPATIGLLTLGKPIISLLLERGNFTSAATLATNKALIFYSLGIISYATLKAIIPAFYALRDTKTPVFVGFLTLALNVILSWLFMWGPLKHAGLALATSISASIQAGILFFLLSKKMGNINTGELLATFAKTFLATLLMGIFCAWINVGIENLYLKVALGVFGGVTIFGFTTYLLKMNEVSLILKLFKKS